MSRPQVQTALRDERLSPDGKLLISATLLPQTRGHIATLDRLLEV